MEQHIQSRSCYRCNLKKVRCNKISPCQRCVGRNVECAFPPPGRAPRRRKRPLKDELTTRLRLLEEKVHKITDEGSNAPENHSDRNDPDLTRETIGTEEKQCGRLLVGERTSRYVNHQALASLWDQVTELQDLVNSPSSSDEDSASPESRSVATTPASASFLGYYSLAHSLRSYHPSKVDSQVLWGAYEENVSLLVPILHKPSIKKLICEASANPESLDENSEALVFAVYFAALTSMKPEYCYSQLREAHSTLIQRYRFATEQALARADFLHSRNLTLLQAMVLLLLCVRGPGDTQLVWVMTAVVHRLGQTLGLHRDGSHFDLNPFETEMRRRLWWQIYLLDTGSSESNAMGAQMQEGNFDTKLPLNINDADISPDSAKPLEERAGFTEMTFFLTRCDFTSMIRQLKQRITPPSIEEHDQAIGEMTTTLEQRRLQYCDLEIPIQWVAATVARIALARTWLVPHFSLMAGAGLDAELWHEKRDHLLVTATEVVEFGHLLETNEKTTQWSWFFETYAQWHAFAFLLSEICVRPISPITDRAWRIADLVYHRWKRGIFQDSGVVWKSTSRLMKRAAAIRSQKLSQDEISKQEVPVPKAKLEYDQDAASTDLFNDILSEMGLQTD